MCVTCTLWSGTGKTQGEADLALWKHRQLTHGFHPVSEDTGLGMKGPVSRPR
jgi:hypothetical protein